MVHTFYYTFTLSTGIRTSLLESEEHVCPTCNQSEVSPDALIANKFLRQVRMYKMCIKKKKEKKLICFCCIAA